MRIWVEPDHRARSRTTSNSINGLNHYIGMKAIEPDEIPELRLMPWMLGGLHRRSACWSPLSAAGGRSTPGLLLFAFGAVAGLVDFWMWGYATATSSIEHAAIKVPGMSYQPPLIGTKQLLNFEADGVARRRGLDRIGGVRRRLCVLCGSAGAWRSRRRRWRRRAATGPRPIALGEEVCRHCHMTIADPRFAAELVTVGAGCTCSTTSAASRRSWRAGRSAHGSTRCGFTTSSDPTRSSRLAPRSISGWTA